MPQDAAEERGRLALGWCVVATLLGGAWIVEAWTSTPWRAVFDVGLGAALVLLAWRPYTRWTRESGLYLWVIYAALTAGLLGLALHLLT